MVEGPESQTCEDREEPRVKVTEDGAKHVYICDRCGSDMIEKSCKVVCHNCGSRYDCSDLNIYFD